MEGLKPHNKFKKKNKHKSHFLEIMWTKDENINISCHSSNFKKNRKKKKEEEKKDTYQKL